MWPGEEGNWQNQSWPGSGPPTASHAAPLIPAPTNPAPTGPAFQQYLPAEQVDWAALAQQWIQMQQQPPGPPLHEIQPPGEEHSRPHQPVENEHRTTHGKSFDNNKDELQQLEQPPYWNTEQAVWNAAITHQAWTGPNARPKETFDYDHAPTQLESNDNDTGNSYDYKHRGNEEYSYSHQPTYDNQYWDQNAPNHTSVSYDKQPGNWDESSDGASQIDLVKRKTLPLWIREGLEKMEKDKQKRIDQKRFALEKLKEKRLEEQSNKKEESLWPKRSRFDSESDDDHSIEAIEHVSPHPERRSRSPTPPVKSPVHREPTPPAMTPAEREQDLIIRVRKMLTEILLEVTKEEIHCIAADVTKKARSRSVAAKQLASSSALASIASNLGLGNYESESEDESGIETKREDSESESDVEAISEKVKMKRLEFERRQSERMFEEGETKSKQDSKSVSEKDYSSNDDGNKEGRLTSTNENAINVFDSASFEEKYSGIPGLDVPNNSVNDDSQISDKVNSSKKHKKQTSSGGGESRSKKKKRSKSRSRSGSRDRKKSRDYKRSKRSYSKSRTRRKRSRSRDYRSRSRSRDRHRSGSRSRDRHRYSRSRSRSRSSSSYSRSRDYRSYSRSPSRDRYKYKKSRQRSRSRSRSPRKSSKRKSGKYKSGKKAS